MLYENKSKKIQASDWSRRGDYVLMESYLFVLIVHLYISTIYINTTKT
jgi:hypothetical protein